MKNKLVLTIIFVVMAMVGMAQPVIITPPEAHIEPGESVTLTASGAMYYQWSPATGLSTTEGSVTVASPMVTTTYTCSGYAPGAESVVNGDFNQGNTGFTSDYEYNTNLFGEGTYYVDYDASLHHQSFVGLGHNGGNFMIVNGATVPGTNVWTEQITVNPNTYYAFSTWVCTLAGQAHEVAWLQFSINGTQIGEVFHAPSYTNDWEQFYELWYSGNSTTATITILNQNTVGSGNDFGLDDISFCELVLVGAPECTVYVGSMSATATADETEFCIGGSTTLHAFPTGGSGTYSFSWTPANTLDDPNAQHPVATPTETTTYTCVVSDGLNTQEVSVTVEVHPNMVHQIDVSICEDDAYDFFGEELDEPGVYEHLLQTQYGCDSLVILVLDVREYQAPPILYQYECYAHGTEAEWYWDKTETTYHQDTYDEIILEDPDGGCPILYRLDLKFHEEFYDEETQISCAEYYWPVTGDTYFESQELTRTFHTTFGDVQCDSTYVLHLTIADYETNEFTVPEDESCDAYFWDPKGKDYHTFDDYDPDDHLFSVSGSYQRVYSNQMGCDSIVTMYVNIDYSPHPAEIEPMESSSHWVITATEFQILSYDFTVEDLNPDCRWDSVRWTCDEAPQWMLEPFGEQNRNCKLYVLNHVDDTVWLRAYAYNHCTSDEGVEQKFWLVCSFFGVDEDGPATLGTEEAFSVAPNPNRGQMTLHFERLTGKIDVKVYDMRGYLLDRFQTISTDSHSLQYDMGERPDGIYLIMVTGNEGTLLQKIIIER